MPETVLYRFSDGPGYVNEGDLVFDQAGNIYGTRCAGRKLWLWVCFPTDARRRRQPEGNILYNFRGNAQGGNDGAYSYGGVIFDGAPQCLWHDLRGGVEYIGTIFPLTPSESGGGPNRSSTISNSAMEVRRRLG